MTNIISTNEFLKELNNTYFNEEDDSKVCSINLLPFDDNAITLPCKHKFNYSSIFDYVYSIKKTHNRYNSVKLKLHEIQCPMCRNISDKLLPFVPREMGEKRVRGIAVRQELTGEWKNRGVDENREFAILTNEISKATFGKTIEEHKKIKNINKENLRDHMDELELIFGMLGEKVTTEITINKDAHGFVECAVATKQGGDVAGNARKEAEKKIGKPIVSEENFLDEPEKLKKKRKLIEVKNDK